METPDLPDDDELVLAIWEGGDAALADLVMREAGKFEKMIQLNFPSFDGPAVEDVVSEGIRRFWEKRAEFDANRSIAGFVYGFVKNVAREHAGCGVNWQKVRQREVTNLEVLPDQQLEDHLDEIETRHQPVLAALEAVLRSLNPMHRALWEAYALSRDEVNAGELGVHLGNEFKDGKPIPANTIRGTRKRVYEKVRTELKKRGFDLDVLGRRK